MGCCRRHHTCQKPQQLAVSICVTVVPKSQDKEGSPGVLPRPSASALALNIESLEPFSLNVIIFQLKYDIYGSYKIL